MSDDRDYIDPIITLGGDHDRRIAIGVEAVDRLHEGVDMSDDRDYIDQGWLIVALTVVTVSIAIGLVLLLVL